MLVFKKEILYFLESRQVLKISLRQNYQNTYIKKLLDKSWCHQISSFLRYRPITYLFNHIFIYKSEGYIAGSYAIG